MNLHWDCITDSDYLLTFCSYMRAYLMELSPGILGNSVYSRLLWPLNFKLAEQQSFIGKIKSRPQNKQGWFLSIINGTFIQININLKNVEPTFFKCAQMQSVLVFSNFAHLRPFLAFLSFFWVFLQFTTIQFFYNTAVIVIFQLILWPFHQLWN